MTMKDRKLYYQRIVKPNTKLTEHLFHVNSKWKHFVYVVMSCEKNVCPMSLIENLPMNKMW